MLEKHPKNCSLLIASRTIDTFKIINYANKFKIILFVEKPLSENVDHFNKLKKNFNNIFVGYNRLFYNNVIYLKKRLKKVDNVLVKCPEFNAKDIVLNSAHVVSIILHLFGKIKILSKVRNKNSLTLYCPKTQKCSYMFYISPKIYKQFLNRN